MLLRTREADIGLTTGINTREIARSQPAGLAPDRLRGAAEQGDRRPQRLPARVRHPPGRRAQGALDLRDHDRRRRSASTTSTRSCSASTPAAMRCSRRCRSWATRSPGHDAQPGVQALQGARGQEEAGVGDGPGGARHRRAAHDAAACTLEWFDVEASTRRPPHATVTIRTPDGQSVSRRLHRRRPGRRDLQRDQAATGLEARLPRVPRRRRDRRQGRARRGERHPRARRFDAAGQGVATDIIEAAALAYVRALSNVERKVRSRPRSPRPRTPLAHRRRERGAGAVLGRAGPGPGRRRSGGALARVEHVRPDRRAGSPSPARRPCADPSAARAQRRRLEGRDGDAGRGARPGAPPPRARSGEHAVSRPAGATSRFASARRPRRRTRARRSPPARTPPAPHTDATAAWPTSAGRRPGNAEHHAPSRLRAVDGGDPQPPIEPRAPALSWCSWVSERRPAGHAREDRPARPSAPPGAVTASAGAASGVARVPMPRATAPLPSGERRPAPPSAASWCCARPVRGPGPPALRPATRRRWSRQDVPTKYSQSRKSMSVDSVSDPATAPRSSTPRRPRRRRRERGRLAAPPGSLWRVRDSVRA